jgi:hypothetical protein
MNPQGNENRYPDQTLATLNPTLRFIDPLT